MNAWSGDLEFHKKTAIADGGDSLFAAGVDSAYAFGVSDTTWSEVYRSKGSTSIQFEVTGTLTASYIEVWTANSGDYQPQWLPEKYFRPAYWVVTGTGMANNYVSTSKDSVTAAAITLPIFIPMLDGELFKVLYITSPVNGAAEKSWLHAHVQLREGDN